ncbi:MAG TPA: glycosyltransferase family 2 protein [Candidatus Saccharimonadales bacterium]|jgi:dolichol-phosphate mannosyltransferase
MPFRRPAHISLVIPVHNEELNLLKLFRQLQKVMDGLPFRPEYIFVDDGSTDGSRMVLAGLEQAYTEVRVIEFSRNFGKEIAVSAGLQAATGKAAIILDADMQHPVALIPEFIGKWKAGAEVVVGVRERYGSEPVVKRATSWLFYRILSRISDTPVTPRSTDYRLLDRVVIDAFNQLSERGRLTRGLIDWLGFRREYVSFRSADRLYGQASYHYRKLFGLAVNSFVSLSLFPLRAAGWLGIIITTVAGFAGLFMIVEQYLLGDPLGLDFSGPAMLAVLNMFWIGIILIALGLVALYIASIHAEVINRPLYVVRPPQKKRYRKVKRA